MAEVKDRSAAESVLAPKLAGTLSLRAAFGDRPLDFVALCSSVTAVTGDFGQVDYCAANAFLDAYAGIDHGFAAPVVSHNWGGWAEVGMAVEVAAPAALRGQRGEVAQPLDHPMLTSRSGTECYGVIAPATHWVLDQHRIAGVPVVPGTAHLEAVRATVEACVPRPSEAHMVELCDVAFLTPLGVTDSAEYRVTLTGDQFEVTSRVGGRTAVHVRGTAGWVEAAPAAPVDLAGIVARCEPVAAGGGRSSLLTFGARWDALRDHRIGADEEIARIIAPEPGGERWGLEPALLDVATAFGTGRGHGSYLPLGYGQVVVHAPLPDTFASHLRYSGDGDEVVTADVTLCDGDGRVLVEITDFTLRRVDPDAIGAGLAGESAGPTASGEAGTAGGDRADAGRAPDGLIRPVDGAEAFRRALAPYLGSRVVISTVSVEELRARRVSTTELAADAADGPTGPLAAITGDGIPPRTPLEATLVDMWQAVLGVDGVGVDHDFFGLGGNSLVAVQLIAQIRKATGVRLPMRALFDTPTIAELAVYIDGLPKGGDQPDDGSPTTIPRLRR
jgi:acyl carrier protein